MQIPKSKTTFTRPAGAGNFDNMDDHNIVRTVQTQQGTIEHIPTKPNDIANKAYIDEQIMELLKNYTFVEDVTSSQGPNYSGWADTGNADNTDLPVWRIKKSTHDGTGDWLQAWADGNDDFDNIWDDRLSLTYT